MWGPESETRTPSSRKQLPAVACTEQVQSIALDLSRGPRIRPHMEAPRAFDVVIVGKGPLSISLPPPHKFSVLRTSIKREFGLAPREMDALELRRVGEEPTSHNAARLFDDSAGRAIVSTADLPVVDAPFIVGKVGAPAGGCLRRLTPRARRNTQSQLVRCRVVCLLPPLSRTVPPRHSPPADAAGAASGTGGGELRCAVARPGRGGWCR